MTSNIPKHEHADWCNYKHGRCECGAVDQKQPKEATTPEPREWLIRKRGYYYRPNRAGYTASVAEAGRYTKAEAENEAALEPWHMAAVHESAVHESAVSEPRLPSSNEQVAHLERCLQTVTESNDRLRAAFNSIRAKLAEYLERLLQGRTLPNRWVGEINDIVGAALSGDSSAPETSPDSRDAARYRWLRQARAVYDDSGRFPQGEALDECCDAFMAKNQDGRQSDEPTLQGGFGPTVREPSSAQSSFCGRFYAGGGNKHCGLERGHIGDCGPSAQETGRDECQHDLLRPDTTIEVIDPWKAKCKVCVTFFDLPGRPDKETAAGYNPDGTRTPCQCEECREIRERRSEKVTAEWSCGSCGARLPDRSAACPKGCDEKASVKP